MQAPLDSLDLSLVSILYTQGNMAAFTPSFNYNFQILNTSVQISSWRQLLYWLGPPGTLPGLPMLAAGAVVRIAACDCTIAVRAHGTVPALLRNPELRKPLSAIGRCSVADRTLEALHASLG